jgi:hypothetical protein
LIARALFLVAVLLVGASAAASGPADSAKKPAKNATPSAKSTKSKKHVGSRGKRSRKTASWRRGQQRIDSARAREIQEALIREDYLDGKATGVWDQASQKAMEKYQADNGWQHKTVPDARALIKLGLGPNHDHLLNPESAMTSPIETPSATAHPTTEAPAMPSGSVGGPSRPQD